MPTKKRGSKTAGQYVGILNALSRADKSKVKKTREAKGLVAAISQAKKLRAKKAKKAK